MTAMVRTPGEAPFDLDAYLRRIGLDAPPPVTVEGLARMVQAHRMAIAFENLDIMLGRGISLAPDRIFDKLVHQGRGGYCFEHNALFDRALGVLGFVGRPLMARVWFRHDGDDAPPRTHQSQLVMVNDEPWIVDAGFGGSLTPPLPLREGESAPTEEGVRFRMRQDAEHGWMLERQGALSSLDLSAAEIASWQPQYSFTLQTAHPADLEMGNHWTSTRPAARFTTMPIVHRITDGGFASLIGAALKWRGRNGAGDQRIETPGQMRRALDQHFGMTFTLPEAEQLFARCG